MTHLNKHIFANYTGVVVTTLLTFLVVPFYLKWLGADAYGLIGVATMIQGWVMLLNAGLAPVAGRQAAQAHGGNADWQQTGRFFRTIDSLLFVVSLLVIGIVFLSRQWLAEHWLEKNSLGAATVELSLVLLVTTTLIRLANGVSRGIITNFEQQVWLNVNLINFNLWRFAVSLPIVYFWRDINVLFIWWLLVSIGEYISVQRQISRTIPVAIPLFVIDMAELKKHGKMVIALGITSGIWIVVTNLDKLLLSTILSLADYGYFSIATLLASGVLILSQPISQAFQPRLTKAFSQGGIEAVCNEFRHCTHWTALLIFPVGAVIFAMPETILFLWTQNKTAAVDAANILRGYVFGSMLLSATTLFYVVQVAIGNVRWHLRGNLIFAAFLFPAIPWVVLRYGADGAAWLWAGFNLVLFIVWNTFLIKKLVRPLYPRWLLVDTLLPLIISMAIALCANYFFISKIHSVISLWLFVIGLTLFILAAVWFFVGWARRCAHHD
jgi:O-antigen/teichoic acid export membrane protein